MSTTNRTMCLVCGKPIKPNEVYCDEHKEYADRDNKTLDNIPLELLFPLIEAIFVRARTDYIFNSEGQRESAERFFRSDWAQTLSLSQFEPDDVIDGMDEEILYGLDFITEDTDRGEW